MQRPSAAVVSTEALLDRIVQRSPVGMAVIDHEGLFRVVNPAYGAIFGYALKTCWAAVS
jgi:PAS domain S-box-containing protein